MKQRMKQWMVRRMKQRTKQKKAWKTVRNMEGSFTLEAALLMCILIPVIFGMLMFTLWLKDCTELTGILSQKLYSELFLEGGGTGDKDLLLTGDWEWSVLSETSREYRLVGRLDSLRLPFGIHLSCREELGRKRYHPTDFLYFCRMSDSVKGLVSEGG